MPRETLKAQIVKQNSQCAGEITYIKSIGNPKEWLES